MIDLQQAVAAQERDLVGQQRRGRGFVALYALAATTATVTFAALVVLVRDDDLIRHFDGPIARAIQGVQWPPVAWSLTHVSDLGVGPPSVLCVTLIALALFVLRLRIEALAIIVSTTLAGEVGTLTKDLVQRARPTAGFVHLANHLADYSFPSGHVIFATVLFGTTACLVWITWPRSWPRDAVLTCLALLVVLMGLSRVYLGLHWPTDVIGAYCLAGLWVAGTVELILVIKPRVSSWSRQVPARPRWSSPQRGRPARQSPPP